MLMRLLWMLVLGLPAGCASQAPPTAKADPSVLAAPSPLDCRPAAGPATRQRQEVAAVLSPIEAEQTQALGALERTQPQDEDDRLNRLLRDYYAKRRRVLEPLAAVGHAEAMMRLA